MNRARLAAAVFVIIVMAGGFLQTSAQMVVDKNRSPLTPDQSFGFGINNAGLHIQYAMGPAFHIGFNLNLDVNRNDANKPDIYHFGPYAKYLFSGGIFHPYLFGAVGVLQPGSGQIGVQGRTGQSDSVYARLPVAELSVKLAAGAEHFFSEDFGMYGHVNLISAVLSPAPVTTGLGLQGAVVGIEVFF